MLEPCKSCRAKGYGDPNCTTCYGNGNKVVVSCPYPSIDPIAYEVLAAADLAQRGSWPVSGGWLEQSRSCRDAVRFVWDERRRLGLNNRGDGD